MAKITRNISFSQFGDLLQEEWEKGNITQEVHDYIAAGVVPIRLLEEKLNWLIERQREGIRLTINDNEIDEKLNVRRAA